MIKNKEKIKEELKNKMSEEIDKYVEAMDQGFHNESFPIDEIESLWGNAIKGCSDVIQQGTEVMLNSLNEVEIISKKKRIRRNISDKK